MTMHLMETCGIPMEVDRNNLDYVIELNFLQSSSLVNSECHETYEYWIVTVYQGYSIASLFKNIHD